MSRTKRVPPSFHAVRDLVERHLEIYPVPLRVHDLMKAVVHNGFTRVMARDAMDHLVRIGQIKYIIKGGDVCIVPVSPEEKGGGE
ncbi:hypothetical protein [Zobellella denitrificans]